MTRANNLELWAKWSLLNHPPNTHLLFCHRKRQMSPSATFSCFSSLSVVLRDWTVDHCRTLSQSRAKINSNWVLTSSNGSSQSGELGTESVMISNAWNRKNQNACQSTSMLNVACFSHFAQEFFILRSASALGKCVWNVCNVIFSFYLRS